MNFKDRVAIEIRCEELSRFTRADSLRVRNKFTKHPPVKAEPRSLGQIYM